MIKLPDKVTIYFELLSTYPSKQQTPLIPTNSLRYSSRSCDVTDQQTGVSLQGTRAGSVPKNRDL